MSYETTYPVHAFYTDGETESFFVHNVKPVECKNCRIKDESRPVGSMVRAKCVRLPGQETRRLDTTRLLTLSIFNYQTPCKINPARLHWDIVHHYRHTFSAKELKRIRRIERIGRKNI
ncbi:MAG: hypothetical protein UT63_C0058G0012 [Candidatus Gottesmanbacteria bacterium GW2011_GWC2_39_8]|uniref:Uncharacterized protein n=1 Tax=Candidatus Gottesmanbacteria bacterium GW2011_GWC2_39_8 TaxID=1618450 RepID=A0A0G0Q3C2_9BACT|nr:MAG: hypothetical protein UT63_C0058G0012 [Candidatus Gottesmanbacteria bacterium GW2011_GWC2_39_8]